jgi:hypothetical protein
VRGVLVFLCLLAFPAAASAATEQVQDGGFEAGFSGWAIEDGAERCEANTSCGPVPAASGSFYVASQTLTSLPPFSGSKVVGSVTQLVPVPELPATLSFQVREIALLGELPAVVQVEYDGEVIGEVETAGESFEPVSLAVPGILGGPTARPLTFTVICSNFGTGSGSCPRFDLDDVSLLTGEPSAAVSPPASGGSAPISSPPPDVASPETAFAGVKRKATVRTKAAKAKIKARFSSEPGARFECKLDRRPYAACSSPKTLKLKVGTHVFRVRAFDAAGNVDPSPAKAVIRVKLKPA